jgi:Ca2+-dependent lipid-binding protein
MLSAYYEILGLPDNASDEEIRKAFRKKAKQYHPDVNKSPDANARFILIKKAYEILINRNSYSSASTATHRANPMTSYEAYMSWRKSQQEKAEYEAKLRHQEFLRNKQKLKESVWYYPLYIMLYIATIFCYLFAAFIICICAYITHKTHIVFALLMFPFISGAIYFINRTRNWHREAIRYFR